MKKKKVLLVFLLLLSLFVSVGCNTVAFASASDVPDLPSWVKVGTYAVYDVWSNQSGNFDSIVWRWEIVSISDTIQVIHRLEGNLTNESEAVPGIYMSTINATTRGITNIVRVDKEMQQGQGFPFMMMFSLWIPEDVGIGENVSVWGPYGSGYPPLPFLRLEDVDSPLETQECAVIGVEIEQGYVETDLFYYNTQTNVLTKFYMNWSILYDAESGYLLNQWVPTKEFDFNVGESNYTVVVSSNSTIGGPNLNLDQKQISFNVTGSTGTAGFCNVTIPEDLLWGDFSVYLDGTLLVEDVDYTRTYNGTHNIFYITYNHSSHIIEITGTEVIPEYYSWLIPSLLLTATLIIVIYKKKLFRLSP